MTTILCVEDNENNVFVISRVLRRAGFEVLVARDGEEGVAMAQSDRPDLILMDLTLPVIDGLEATRRIKAAPETRAIPVVALSAHSENEKAGEARAAGCDEYAGKPLDVRSLLTKVRTLLLMDE